MMSRIDWEEIAAGRGAPPAGGGRLAAFVIAGLVLLGGFDAAVRAVTELWWFQSLDLGAVYLLRLGAPLGLFLLAFVVGALWLTGNWRLAVRRSSAAAEFPDGEDPFAAILRSPRLALLAGVAFAAIVAIGVASEWSTFLLALRGPNFGSTDPILALDAGWYIFRLPALEVIQGAASFLAALAVVGTLAFYLAGCARSLREGSLILPAAARPHLAVLTAVWLVIFAAGKWLARFQLLATHRGPASAGPGFVDVTVRMPAYAVLAIAGLVAAVVLLAAAWRSSWRPAVAAMAAVATLSVVLGGLLPGFIQRYRVQPDELTFERPYLVHAISTTLQAHGLNKIRVDEYDPKGRLTEELLERHAATFQNVRLWDWRIARRSFQQQQEIRPQYEFLDLDVDRYRLAGEEAARQVLLSARELMVSQIKNPTWVTRHLAFTHGVGAVVAPVDEADSKGSPVLWVRDIPPKSRPPWTVDVTQPRIYFGEGESAAYVIVGTNQAEFDFQAGEKQGETSYSGADGVDIGSFARRLLFALREHDIEILLSDALRSDSRILIHRHIVDRLAAIAPFLHFDQDPYLVITADGRLVWLADAYTGTDRYPYSAPIPYSDPAMGGLAGLSYARNSVKATVDAYDGTVRLYVVDPSDPMIQAWQAVYPSLFAPRDAMPAELVQHWRYPEALFRAQTAIYSRYHMKDPDSFYLAEDLWQVPSETLTQDEWIPMEPYYVTIGLRGEASPEFVLMLPFSPAGKKNMIAWMAARSDPGHYGELVVYGFARGEFVVGPEQVEGLIDQDPNISKELTLLGQAGSTTIRGNLLVIPVEDTLVFVEPLYIEAERTESATPQLKRVIVVSGDRVIMRPTLAAALAAVASGSNDVAEGVAGPESAPVEDLVRNLRSQWDRAYEARRDGDWLDFGREMSGLEAALMRLENALGGASEMPITTTDTAAPAPDSARPTGTP